MYNRPSNKIKGVITVNAFGFPFRTIPVDTADLLVIGIGDIRLGIWGQRQGGVCHAETFTVNGHYPFRSAQEFPSHPKKPRKPDVVAILPKTVWIPLGIHGDAEQPRIQAVK